MKIAFFTEGQWYGKISRDHPNMRTDLAWQCALQSDHYPLIASDRVVFVTAGFYDLGIVIIPKKNPTFNIDHVRRVCNQVAVMQEGPHWYWQDWPVFDQFQYITLLSSVDIIYVHNKADEAYYEGLTEHRDIRILRSLIIEDAIDIDGLMSPLDRVGVMLGGNFVSWYGGMDSYAVASVIEEPMYVPSMGRMPIDEDRVDGLSHYSYVSWRDWISLLSRHKYGVHLMRTHAAGTFALNCAYLGIPCVGYYGLDTQQLLHPGLTVHAGDLSGAKTRILGLKYNEELYDYFSKTTKELYNEHYAESVFLDRFYSEFK